MPLELSAIAIPAPIALTEPVWLHRSRGRSEAAGQRIRQLPAPGREFRPQRGRLWVVQGAAELIRRCQAGDEAAFGELFDLHHGDVRRIVLKMVGSGPDLDDLVQDVFLQVFRSIGHFQGNARFTTWLYRVSVNVVLMYRRAARSRPTLVAESLAHAPTDRALSPEEATARNKRIEAFYRLLDQLSEKKRTVFVLHELEGMAPAEIAKVVRAPLLTVRTRLFYARREIEKLLGSAPELAGILEQGPELGESGSDAGQTARRLASEPRLEVPALLAERRRLPNKGAAS